MKRDTKKYLIYIRYSLPTVALIVMFAMLFVPSYRFIFSGKAGERMSAAALISNSWEQVREVLFSAQTQTNSAILFSQIVFWLIIIFAVLFLISLFVSVWSAIVAFRCFLSENEQSTERSRRLLCVFLPNRIVLVICSSIGIAIATLPYLMRPIYALTYSESVTAVLEAPDALIVGALLLVCSALLSVVCAPMERVFDADIFKKDKDTEEAEEYEEEKEEAVEYHSKQNEEIRRLFLKENGKKNLTEEDEKEER